MKQSKPLISACLALSMVCGTTIPAGAVVNMSSDTAAQDVSSQTVINVTDFGADPTGRQDSADAIWKAFEAAKKASNHGQTRVTVNFPKGEYHIYKDMAQQRVYHTSNTNSIEHPTKTIGLLIEDQDNLVVEGNGSLFMMHGNMMALAVVHSKNITLRNFSWDFAVPTVSEMTILGMGTEGGKEYTDFYIPTTFPYAITGKTITWSSELSPYTKEPYWTRTGHHEDSYCIVGYSPEDEMSRRYDVGGDSPFHNVSSIRQLNDGDTTKVRITYNGKRPAMQKPGLVLEFASSFIRETAGAFTWESENVLADHINVHFMHGFGWLIQMSKDVYYRHCNLMPRENSGHVTVGFADGIHASGAAGEIVIEDCNFSHTHDDPINIHGTFTRVEQRVDDHTLELKYVHRQQGGFPQYHVGDSVRFFARDDLSSSDHETEYTVEEILTNPDQEGGDLRTMRIRFKEELPKYLSDRIGNEPKYVAENVTYSPKVTIRNNTFKNIATRGILCTTGQKVLIEGNDFSPTTMATIFLSNDSNEWYESGPIRDMTIRNNTFRVKTIGGREGWAYAPAIFVHPVTKGNKLPDASNPVHKNITIEDNTFFMDLDSVVRAESVENLIFRNNKVFRLDPKVSLRISLPDKPLAVNSTVPLELETAGKQNDKNIDHLFDFTKCKDVLLEGNTYDDGLKKYAVSDAASKSTLTNRDPDIQIASKNNLPAAAPVRNICYTSSDPDIAWVDSDGNVHAKSNGTAQIMAYYIWNDTVIKSEPLSIEVGETATESLTIHAEKSEIQVGDTAHFTVEDTTHEIRWSVSDFAGGSASDIAEISADGILTAKKNGIVWVNASTENAEGSIPVVVYGDKLQKINENLSIKREDETNYTLDASAVQIKMQRGDLYQGDNTVKNLFLYDIPEKNQDDLRAIVKAEGLPVREDGHWDTASFVLYKDDDNYISIGKKSHKAGFASVKELSANAQEFEDNAEDNNVSEAYLGITKKDGKVTLSAKAGDTWKEIKSFDEAFTGKYQLGFAAWCSSQRNKSSTFSDFRIGSADEDFDTLLEQDPIAFTTEVENDRASVSNVTLSNDDAQVTVHYDFKDEHKEGTTYFLWSWDANGKRVEKITTTPTLTVNTDTIRCKVFPVDAMGQPGIPSDEVSHTLENSNSDELISISVNGQSVYKKGDNKEIEVQVPWDQLLNLSYISANNNVGTVEVYHNSDRIDQTIANTDEIGIQVADQDTLTLIKGNNTYNISIHALAPNDCKIASIQSDALQLNQTADFEQMYTTVVTDRRSADINVCLTPQTQRLQILAGDYRHPVSIQEDDQTYSARLNLANGLNTFYITAIAADGITKEQFVLNVLRTIPNNSSASQVTVTFDTNGGTAIAPVTLEKYSVLTEDMVPEPRKDGMRFIGWQTEDGSSFRLGQEITSDITLYAVWREQGSGSGGHSSHPSDPRPSNKEPVQKPSEAVPDQKPDTASKVEMIPTISGNTASIHAYTDLQDHWAQDAIAWAVTNKLFQGVSETHFAPNQSMTRGMLVTVLHRLAGTPHAAPNTSFVDIAQGTYYQEAVAWAATAGIVSGVSESAFAPNNTITREQLATILYKFAGSPAIPNQELHFADADMIHTWAKDAVAWAVHEGLLFGVSNDALSPSGSATRAQVATILMRFEEKMRKTV